MKAWFRSGAPYIWLTAGTVSLSLIMVIGLVLMIAVHGLEHFWPASVMQFTYQEPGLEKVTVMGESSDHETVIRSRVVGADEFIPEDQTGVERYLFKTGNRDFTGLDFRWFVDPAISNREYPPDAMVVERREWGNFYGYLIALKENDKRLETDMPLWDTFQEKISEATRVFDDCA